MSNRNRKLQSRTTNSLKSHQINFSNRKFLRVFIECVGSRPSPEAHASAIRTRRGLQSRVWRKADNHSENWRTAFLFRGSELQLRHQRDEKSMRLSRFVRPDVFCREAPEEEKIQMNCCDTTLAAEPRGSRLGDLHSPRRSALSGRGHESPPRLRFQAGVILPRYCHWLRPKKESPDQR
jgi:hypothetical protein